ncbi:MULTISPECIES: hypothetical protein [Saccharothrix]|uniref:hypothetical protein n=1 Tax=Saccharothrix TaxID=2071 RepID=UPI00093FB231|nr:hypothetical protein [Saccharothrix sp. CB00851]OKI35299.1 hypothetical protein A6A25_24480 [Saccharothrix sp. CB00851]
MTATDPFDSHDQAVLSATALVTETARAHLARLHTTRTQRRLRAALPGAALLLVDTSDYLHGQDELRLLAVRDDDGVELWRAADGPTPRMPAGTGRWEDLLPDLRRGLECALTPNPIGEPGWRPTAPEPDTESDGIHQVALVAGLPTTGGHDPERLRALIAQLSPARVPA